MKVAGTTVTADDVDGGVVVVFKTATGDVAELRRRVHHMAEKHGEHHAGGHHSGGMMRGGHGAHGGGPHGGPAAGGPSHEMMVPATVAAEDIEGGARIVLTPKEPSQLAALRAHVHGHAERMERGECPMMATHGGGS